MYIQREALIDGWDKNLVEFVDFVTPAATSYLLAMHQGRQKGAVTSAADFPARYKKNIRSFATGLASTVKARFWITVARGLVEKGSCTFEPLGSFIRDSNGISFQSVQTPDFSKGPLRIFDFETIVWQWPRRKPLHLWLKKLRFGLPWRDVPRSQTDDDEQIEEFLRYMLTHHHDRFTDFPTSSLLGYESLPGWLDNYPKPHPSLFRQARYEALVACTSYIVALYQMVLQRERVIIGCAGEFTRKGMSISFTPHHDFERIVVDNIAKPNQSS